jgi:hypothetical protein
LSILPHQVFYLAQLPFLQAFLQLLAEFFSFPLTFQDLFYRQPYSRRDGTASSFTSFMDSSGFAGISSLATGFSAFFSSFLSSSLTVFFLPIESRSTFPKTFGPVSFVAFPLFGDLFELLSLDEKRRCP